MSGFPPCEVRVPTSSIFVRVLLFKKERCAGTEQSICIFQREVLIPYPEQHVMSQLFLLCTMFIDDFWETTAVCQTMRSPGSVGMCSEKLVCERSLRTSQIKNWLGRAALRLERVPCNHVRNISFKLSLPRAVFKRQFRQSLSNHRVNFPVQ